MRLGQIISKNFKLLFRNKSSALVVIIGPLLIILLVALAFHNSSTINLTIGVHTPDSNALTQNFVTGLEAENYTVEEFFTQEDCIDNIKQGLVHTCISFPEDFKIENNRTNVLEFYVDNSRQNLVYQVIESVKKTVTQSSQEVSLNLTGSLLDAISVTQIQTDASLVRITQLESKATQLSNDISKIKVEVANIQLDVGNTNLGGITTEIASLSGDFKDLRKKGLEIVDLADTLEEDATAGGFDTGNFSNDLDELQTQFENLENSSQKDINDLVGSIENTQESLDTLSTKIESAKTAKTNINVHSTQGQAAIDLVRQDLDAVKGSLQTVKANVDSLSITDASNIVSPITTEVHSVASENSQLIFIYPFLLVLVIMFVGVLLSSTLIVIDKNSPAFFRTFTTSTKDEYFILSTYLTALIMVMAQVLILMALGAIFLKSSIFGNWQVTLVHLFFTSSLFVMIGMAIGYLFSTQQAANIMSISVGSVFLFLSDLVLPLESVNPALRTLATLNPYVMASDVLRKSTVFESSFLDVQVQLGMLMLYGVLVLIFILMTHKLSKLKYFGKIPHIKGKLPITLGEDSYFQIGEKFIIRNKGDLLVALRNLPTDDFHSYIDKNRKEFSQWVRQILKDPTLARKLKRKNQAQMVELLEKVVDPKELPKEKDIEQQSLQKPGEDKKESSEEKKDNSKSDKDDAKKSSDQ